MAHIFALDGDLTILEGCVEKVAKLICNFGCDIRQPEKNKIVFSFYGETMEDKIEGFVSSIKGLIVNGVIDVLDDNEDAYSAYIFRNGEYEYANGLPLIYYQGHADLFVESLPKEIIHAVLKKYGNQSNQSV